MVLGPHDPAMIRGGSCFDIQHIIAGNHRHIGTPSGGPQSVSDFHHADDHPVCPTGAISCEIFAHSISRRHV